MDYISGEDITFGKLENYKSLYLNGIQILPKASEKIAKWVQNSDVLYGEAGAGSVPISIMSNVVIGMERRSLKNQCIEPA